MLRYVVFGVFDHFELRATTYDPPDSSIAYYHSVLIRTFPTFQEAKDFLKSQNAATLYSLIYK